MTQKGQKNLKKCPKKSFLRVAQEMFVSHYSQITGKNYEEVQFNNYINAPINSA
jgi:hypothetical protein